MWNNFRAGLAAAYGSGGSDTGPGFNTGAARGIIGQMFAVRAPIGATAGAGAAVAAEAAAVEPTVISGLGSKAAARAALNGIDLPASQAAAARSAISRGTAGSHYELMLQTDGRLFVHISRPGGDGFQVMQSIITPSGSKMVTQYGVPVSGPIHVHPKF